MVVSHANDSYFWVVTQFSGLTLNQGYRLQTLGTLVSGVTAVLGVWVLSLFFCSIESPLVSLTPATHPGDISQVTTCKTPKALNLRIEGFSDMSDSRIIDMLLTFIAQNNLKQLSGASII
jgi:hypothetical protein